MLFAVVFMLFPGGTAHRSPCHLAAPGLTVEVRRGQPNMCNAMSDWTPNMAL